MREHAQIGNDVLDAFETVFDVFEDFFVFLLLPRGEVLPFFAEGEEAGGGEVQRVVDFVDNAGAHAAEGGELLRLNELRFRFFELFDGGFEHLILFGDFALVLVRLDQVFDAHVQFSRGERLGEEIAGARGKGREFGFFIGSRGEEDDGDALRGCLCADFTASLQAILFGHHHVQQDEVGQELARLVNGLLAIHRLDHAVVRAELRFEESEHIGLVVRHQDGRLVAVAQVLDRPDRRLQRSKRGK